VSVLPGHAREQPGGRDAEQAAPAGLPAGREPGDEVVQRGGQHDRAAAQAQEGAAAFVLDVLGCQRRDDVQLLGVEQDEEPGDAVGGQVGVVVEESSRVTSLRGPCRTEGAWFPALSWSS
jgi:hypothetical protein